MPPRQIALVTQSWQQVGLQADVVAEFFYARLFGLDPALRTLFKKDVRTQGRMLTSIITLAVSQLDRLDKLVPVARALGERHATYSVEGQHYATVPDSCEGEPERVDRAEQFHTRGRQKEQKEIARHCRIDHALPSTKTDRDRREQRVMRKVLERCILRRDPRNRLEQHQYSGELGRAIFHNENNRVARFEFIY